MDAAAAGLIGAFGGAGIGFLGALKVNADRRQEEQRSERRRAFATYLGALYPVVSELREMPPNAEPNLLSQAIDKLGSEQASWMATRKRLVAANPHMFGRMDRLSAAMAQVQTLAMPVVVVDAVEKANDYAAELGDERSEELVAKWPAVREELLDKAKLL
jgi:hypothetical protein